MKPNGSMKVLGQVKWSTKYNSKADTENPSQYPNIATAYYESYSKNNSVFRGNLNLKVPVVTEVSSNIKIKKRKIPKQESEKMQ